MSDKVKDATLTLGTIITEEMARDAVHVAVENVAASETFRPGQHVSVKDGIAYPACNGKPVGVVDPFLSSLVEAGERFWLFVYPRTITSLRHIWQHPDIPAITDQQVVQATEEANPDRAESEAWMREFCSRNDCPPYDILMMMLRGEDVTTVYGDHVSYHLDREYFSISGMDAHCAIPNIFWQHAEVLTGRTFTRRERPRYFTCSC
jgi:hypothetical protein